MPQALFFICAERQSAPHIEYDLLRTAYRWFAGLHLSQPLMTVAA